MNHSCLDNVIFSTIKNETCFSYNNYDKNRKFTFLKIESNIQNSTLREL